jgi:HK97 family phage major capsid protein
VNRHKLKQLINRKLSEAQKITDATMADGKFRDMTEEECKKFDDLMAEVASMKKTLAKLSDVEQETETEETEEASGRSNGRASNPDQFGGTSPAVHTRKHRYSIHRAMRAAIKGLAVDGLEAEVSKEVRNLAKNKEFKGQFSMPIDPSDEMRALTYPRYNGYIEQRSDLTTTTGAGGIFTVPELPLIDLLRPRLVIARRGCTMLTGMQGLFAIPRQSGKSTVNWIGEGSSATASAPTLDNVPFSPKLAVDAVNISRQFINQTSVSAETFTLNDLARSLAVEWDRVSIDGAGTGSNQPLGIMQISAIQTESAGLAIGPSGGLASWATVVNMEAQVANLNADSGKLAYLTNPTQRGRLKQIPKGASSTFPLFIWEDGKEPGVGTVNSYPAYATTNVPNNLTKGSGSNLSSLIYGNWEDLVIASWDDGIDFLINPYSNQLSAAVLISMEMSVDSEVRHPESFALVSDAA